MWVPSLSPSTEGEQAEIEDAAPDVALLAEDTDSSPEPEEEKGVTLITEDQEFSPDHERVKHKEVVSLMTAVVREEYLPGKVKRQLISLQGKIDRGEADSAGGSEDT
ncbi:hypothetical protein BSKO_12625 [Bryopsis sp. KO-2023]|nr:hypothetical protein BSKO_02615 [Bryopsis sp. KO-2023]GMH39360.1 hypothetical protein BSKO_07258 [Bryopsis sp. KO-2023]GMH41165.1 hypothetical protein BSKO_09075 [Bryopsis sp. KO-2023]GMH44673.1 hypothetical protein BSKO_12625 [Bryopsis sp. KO-2023]